MQAPQSRHPSFRRKPESSLTQALDSGLRRNDETPGTPL